jgi:hypothetical protein
MEQMLTAFRLKVPAPVIRFHSFPTIFAPIELQVAVVHCFIPYRFFYNPQTEAVRNAFLIISQVVSDISSSLQSDS